MAPHVPGEMFNLKNREFKQRYSIFVSDLASIGNLVIRFIERSEERPNLLTFLQLTHFILQDFGASSSSCSRARVVGRCSGLLGEI